MSATAVPSRTLTVLMLALSTSAAAGRPDAWRNPDTVSSQVESSQTKPTLGEAREQLRRARELEADRDRESQIEMGLDSLGLRRGMNVAEIGAQDGYLVEKLARRVGPEGRVYGEDIVAWGLEVLKVRMAESKLTNYEAVLGSETDPRLPTNAIDMVFFHWTMPYVKNPVELFRNITPALRPGGRIVLIEVEFGQVMGRGGVRGTDPRYRTRAAFEDIFARASYRVERIDSATLPYLTIYVLVPQVRLQSPGGDQS